MSQRNKDRIISWNDEMFNKGNIAVADKAFAPESQLDSDHLHPDQIKQMVTEIRSAFPDVKVSVDHLVAEGDMVAWRRTTTGTHEGDYRGIPASGKEVTWTTMVISRFVDGKITEEWSSSNRRSQIQSAHRDG